LHFLKKVEDSEERKSYRIARTLQSLDITVIFCEMFFRYAMGAAMNAGDFFVRIKIAGK